jgi:hypothetical protein
LSGTSMSLYLFVIGVGKVLLFSVNDRGDRICSERIGFASLSRT